MELEAPCQDLTMLSEVCAILCRRKGLVIRCRRSDYSDIPDETEMYYERLPSNNGYLARPVSRIRSASLWFNQKQEVTPPWL